ncbi:galactitol-1-phosphate 5-dehydrogenase [Alginatibacterium sediminis]|uniref:Galactitol-1-phosphate 5-dehydrogenase n=2 Tax=Alginatibacterium sediminis TaxID=2164068 RepID=A0A420EII8_9ALTE|nr:galactitol-1-phosphate 5-dehydrogenase [Alginatibacterium sediminis]
MLEVVVAKNRELRVIESVTPIAVNDEVLIQVAFSGLCGSDIPRVFHNGAHYYPVTLGHEFSGTVIALGPKVTELKIGDRIACAPLVPCKNCDVCHQGLYSLCKNYSFVGSRVRGGNAQMVAVPQDSCFKLNEKISFKQGAFFEPVTVGIHPILMAGGCTDKNVVVLGVGTIGLLAVQSAKAMGAKTVTAIDIDETKLDKAKTLGADFVFNSLDTDFIAQLQQLKQIDANQLILETAGTPITVKMAIAMAGPRAQIGLVGTLHQDISMTHSEFEQILRKELSLFGSWMNYSKPYPGEEWRITAQLFAENKIDIESLTQASLAPHEYIEEVIALDGKPSNGKILLEW